MRRIQVLEEKCGSRVFLTPRAGDDKADVIAVRDAQVRLIQCKHTAWGATMDADSLAEIVMALDTYRHRHLRAISQRRSLQAVVVTNALFTAAAKSVARLRDVDLISEQELWAMLEQTPCTPGELEAMEARRLASMRDLHAAIEQASQQ